MKIKDHVFVLTGYRCFPDYKADLVRQIESLGGRVDESVSENTHYLVLSRDDTDEWDQDEIDKTHQFLKSKTGSMLSMTTENNLKSYLVTLGNR